MKRKIIEKEIKTAIRESHNGKSPGWDGLPAEFYKTLLEKEPRVLSILARVFNNILETKEMPARWKDGLLTIMFKKGDPEDIKNYRPLTLMNTDYKLFTSILMRRLVRGLGDAIGLHQSAFIPGRLIDDNIRTV